MNKSSIVDKRSKKIPFANYFYVYDIESTKYSTEEYPILAYSYLHGIKKYNFNINLTKDNIDEFSDGYIPLRTNKQIEDYILNINQTAIENNEKVLIFVHNLTYEFYNMIFNMPKLNAILEEDESNVFAISSTKICKLTIGNIEIRDSLMLFGKSLKVCANEVGMKKNEENKTYNEIWTELSDLPEWEYSYNEHDLDIVAVYFAKYVKMLGLETNDIQSFINSRILTITGMVRYISKQVNTKDNLKEQMKIAKQTQKSIDNDTQKWIEEFVFRGGFCKSIPYNSFKLNKDVHSIDFASAYPAVMVTAHYPKGELIDCNGLLYKLDNELKYKTLKEIVDKYWNYQALSNPSDIILFKIKIKNVKIKMYNNNEIGYISISKCENLSNATVLNGSVFKADELIVSGTNLDFIIMRMYYDFEIDEILIEKTTTFVGRLSKFKILAISKFGQEKEGFKQLSKCEEYEEFTNKLNDILFEDIKYNDIFKSTNEIPNETNMQHIIHICNGYLMKSKNNLNSQYGIMVQHQFRQDIKYNNYQFNIDDEETLHWSITENYLQGVFVTAHTRFRLLLMTGKMLCDGMDIVYFDTDSIKLMGDTKVLNKNLKEWNNMIEELRIRLQNKYKNNGYNIFLSNFGDFDYEGTYKYFITHGSKRYICIDDKDVVHTTISGVNKIANSSGATLFYHRFGIQELFREWFGLNTLYDYTLCKRSLNYIPDKPILIEDDIVDDNGKLCRIKQYSCEGISEEDCGYLLSGFDNYISPITYWYCYCLWLRDESINVNIKPHTIKANNCVYDRDGNIIDCEFEVNEGFTITKYFEHFEKKYRRLIKEDKLLKYSEPIHQELHNFKNGLI